jgi:hypothetical protein
VRKIEWAAVAWLAAFLTPWALGFSVRAAAVCTVLVMALSAPAVLLGWEEWTEKGTR